MKPQAYGVILFYSTSHALKGEQVLNEAGIPNKLIPVPRHINSDCGSCLRVEMSQLVEAQHLLLAASVGVEGVHKI